MGEYSGQSAHVSVPCKKTVRAFHQPLLSPTSSGGAHKCTTLRQPRVPNGVSGDGREPDATIVVIARPPPTAPHRTADRTYQKFVRHLVGLRGVCGHLRGCRAVAIFFPQLTVGLVGPESTFERIGPPSRPHDGGTRENAVAANRPLLLITSGLRSRRDSADLALPKIHGARAVVGDCRSWP